MPQELYGRAPIRAAKRISNPGCYATSSQLLLAPLVDYLKPGALPTIFGMSGYSGAGTIMENDASGKPVTKPKVSAESLGTFVRPYSLTGHIHEREAGFHLSTLRADGTQIKVAFIPAVAPWFSGIVSTVSVPLKAPMTAKDVIALFEERYKGEKLITIQKDVVQLRDVEGKHGWTVGGFQMSVEGDRVVITGGLDNLLKGAATQCLQNLNLALGYDEYAGIPIA
ncbi:glyceraldehyde-3-phosphate dehydrogenase-like protein [Pholiota conissans]|uniref:Glyceraldehyde-3-phosphate dehydrogenase-like protein n=1 Tax=Pholiota conissans TaxID=109636 RepID=A0A9P6CXF8_9AGAR|nr:glyceraldehyde-3-phosphate dehydrogenase-like protein [Pholiota conissans]